MIEIGIKIFLWFGILTLVLGVCVLTVEMLRLVKYIDEEEK